MLGNIIAKVPNNQRARCQKIAALKAYFFKKTVIFMATLSYKTLYWQ